jgi:uncharacterized RDD family membrane protein YckC
MPAAVMPGPLAGWGPRFGAWFLDLVISVGPVFLIWGAVSAPTARETTEFNELTGRVEETTEWPAWVYLVWLVLAVVPVLYYVLFHGRTGRTPGKRVAGIRVIDASGKPIGYGQAFLRWLMQFVFWFACFITGILDSLWPLWDDKKQAWHDKVANTVVVRPD